VVPAIMLSLIVGEVRRALGTEKSRRGSATSGVDANIENELAENARRRSVAQPPGDRFVEIEMASNPFYAHPTTGAGSSPKRGIVDIEVNEDDDSLAPEHPIANPDFTNPLHSGFGVGTAAGAEAEQHEDYRAWIETIIVDDEYDDI